MKRVPGWSERQAVRFMGGGPGPNPELLHLEDRLWASHPDANNPLEPYLGVIALFNADLHAVDPAYAPREDWLIQSPEVIVHRPVEA